MTKLRIGTLVESEEMFIGSIYENDKCKAPESQKLMDTTRAELIIDEKCMVCILVY